MIVHTAHIFCRPEYVEAFRSRLLRHAHTTLECEPGCSRFDAQQNTENSNLFLLYEVYQDQVAFDDHRASRHFVEFRNDTADWVSERVWWFWSRCESN